MKVSESQVFEALGLAPEGDSGNTPEAAAPAGQEQAGAPSGEGGKEQTVAESAPGGAEAAQGEKGGEEARAEDGVPGAGTGARQSGREPNRNPAERTRLEEEEKRRGRLSGDSRREASGGFSDDEKRARADAAARRRRQEQQAAIDRVLEAEREKHKAELDALFQSATMKNTITGMPITNMDEFNAWKQALDAAKLQSELKDGELTPEKLEQAISNSPSMQRLRGLLERDEKARQESAAAAAQAKIDAELQEIHKLDPSIRTTEDLLNMPSAKEFYEYVRKGNTFLDAFYLANRRRLTAEAAEAAKQQTMNAARSKEHLHPAGASRGAGAAAVPAEEMELFKLLNPEATDSEIQAYYNKTRRKTS